METNPGTIVVPGECGRRSRWMKSDSLNLHTSGYWSNGGREMAALRVEVARVKAPFRAGATSVAKRVTSAANAL